ncbi:MAG: ROK family protein, partial [Intrasporangium sp.]|uniref:ROK family protein n=1 Tax=Intrasporangium sp. TaxID=1925024 RepID=UPI003F7D91FB
NVGYLAAVVVDLAGTVLVQRLVERDLRRSDPAAVLRRLEDLGEEALGTLPAALRGEEGEALEAPVLVGAGLALPGIVSADSGLLVRAPNLDWSQVDIVGGLDADRLGGVVPSIGNEANLAAMTVTESRPGHPSGLRDFIYLSGETGIGGAVVIDGFPLGGRHGWAGEIGHVSVDPAGPACPCGSTGCLEQYAGKRALLGAAGLEPDAPADLLVDRFRAGDPAAASAVDRAAWALGCALADVVNVVDVPVIVLGGHLRDVAEVLRPRLEATLRRRVLSARWTTPSVELAPRVAAPGALGAAYVALDAVVADPARWLP